MNNNVSDIKKIHQTFNQLCGYSDNDFLLIKELLSEIEESLAYTYNYSEVEEKINNPLINELLEKINDAMVGGQVTPIVNLLKISKNREDDYSFILGLNKCREVKFNYDEIQSLSTVDNKNNSYIISFLIPIAVFEKVNRLLYLVFIETIGEIINQIKVFCNNKSLRYIHNYYPNNKTTHALGFNVNYSLYICSINLQVN